MEEDLGSRGIAELRQLKQLKARSLQSNGMSEAFVNAGRRDYIKGAELWSAAHAISLLPEWFGDDDETVPHSALGMRSPRE